jgi:HPt (histidine-containing phosphotransfer) domain-containing protein
MLRIAAEKGDCRALARCSHSLKGSALTMGATPVIELCHEIEQSARSSAQRDYRADVRRLAEAFDDTRAAMLAHGGTGSVEPERRIDGAGQADPDSADRR